MNSSFLSNDQHQIMKTLLVSLLRLSWIAATLPIIIASIPIPKLNFLRQILLGFAKRGKTRHHSSSSSSSSSQVTPLSHCLFINPFHFYSFPFQKCTKFSSWVESKFKHLRYCFCFCRNLLFLRDSSCISMLCLQYGQRFCLLQLGYMLIEWRH